MSLPAQVLGDGADRPLTFADAPLDRDLEIPLERAGTTDCSPDPIGFQMDRFGLVDFSEEPTGGTWQTWFVAPGDIVVPAPPATVSAETAAELAALHEAALMRTGTDELRAQVYEADHVTKAWTNLYLELIVQHADKNAKRNPPRLAREMAILQTAMFDALVLAWDAKFCYMRPPPTAIDPLLTPLFEASPVPSYPSEHAVAAGVAEVVLRYFFPVDEEPPGAIEDVTQAAAQTRVIAGVNYPSDVAAGYALGKAVGQAVLDARADDGWDAQYDFVNMPGRITGPCNWVPTPVDNEGHGYGPPLEPLWGQVRPFIMASGDQFRAPPPPACDGADYTAQYRDLFEASLILTDRQKDISNDWEAGQGTVTPPGQNLEIALDKTLEHELNDLRAARVMAYEGVAVADAGIAAWDTKFTYWWDRPISAIRRLDWDTDAGLCDGFDDPTFVFGGCWLSLAVTPPFPGYISGHSTFTGAGQETLKYFFPEDENEFRAYQTDAAMARYYGGIHFRHDNDQGVEVGIGIGNLLHERAANDGAD